MKHTRTPSRRPQPAACALAAALALTAPQALAWDDFSDLFRFGEGETGVLWVEGRYLLASGSYRSETAVLGSGDDTFVYDGTVWQTGGNWTVGRLQLGSAPGGVGTYKLDQGLLATGSTGVATSNGWASFSQNGGFHVITGELAVGGTGGVRGASRGSYQMAGGVLSAGSLRVGTSSSWSQLAGNASFSGNGVVRPHGTLTLQGGLLTLGGTLEVQRSGSGTQRGTLNFQGGTMLGTLAVAGELHVTGGDLQGLLEVQPYGVASINGLFSPDAGISNRGTLGISNTSHVQLQGAGLLNDADGVLTQAGRVDGPGDWRNLGQATLAGEFSGTGDLLNSGQLLMDRSLVLDRSGSVGNTGAWTARATVLSLGGSTVFVNEGQFMLDRSRLEGSGTFVNDTAGRFETQGNTRVDTLIDNRGLLLAGGGSLVLSRGLGQSGTLRLDAPGTVVSGGVIDNRGTLLGQGRIDNELRQRGLVRAEGGTLALHGVLDLQAGSRLEVAPAATLRAETAHLRLVGSATLEAGAPGQPPATLAVAGTLAHDGALSGVGRIEAAHARLAGSLQFDEGPSSIAGSVDLRRTGRIELHDGAQLSFEDAVTLRTDSLLSIASGALVSFAGALTLEAGARWEGEGQVQIGSLLDIGAGVAGLAFDGQLLFGAESRYRAQLGASGHDQLRAAGGIAFDGTLVVELLPGFAAHAGDRFQLFDAGQYGGGFAQIDLAAATLPEGLVWDFSALSSQGTLGVMAAVPELPAPALLLGGLLVIGLHGWRRRTMTAHG